MKKITSLLAGCSLMLAGAAIAQQSDDQDQKNKKQQHQEKAHAVQAKPAVNPNAHAAKPKMHAVQQQHAAAVNEHATSNVQNPNVHNAHKAERTLKSEKAADAETNVSGQANVNAMHEAKQHRKEMKAADVNAKTTANPAGADTAATTSAATQQNAQMNAAGGGKKKPDPQKVQQIKQQHANFRAQPKPQQVPAVTFQQNYRIHGADRWQGRQYDVFRSYHPERHDQHWYHSHYNRVELIGGGYYFWNNGYWFPAWGYSPTEEYYAYDAPIYVGQAAEPPDRVIADVQATLQDMGYYKGEVDGLLGPLTREALAGYQADQGLTQTELIDEPTLDSLGLS